MKNLLLVILTVFTSTAFAQTDFPARTDASQVPGLLSTGPNPIAVPARVAAGKAFDVVVTTGGNGCVEQGETGLVLSDRSADIFVYDVTSATQPGTICTMIYKEFKHRATMRFSKKGRAVVRIWARRHSAGLTMGFPVVIERRVIVR